MGAIRLIAGLGNPGRRHERDRHNVGFWFVSRLAELRRVALAEQAKFQGRIGRLHTDATDCWLAMPLTWMNLSGECVAALARFYRIAPDECLVVHDELDFAPGTARIKLGGGVAGHNGLKDIAARLGTQHFWRLRVGIGHPGDRNLVADYVLAKPSPEDREAIDAALARCLEVSPLLLAADMHAAMLKLHTRPSEE